MADLQALFTQQGATLANDGIPLRFGDLADEYRAARETAVLLDRSHEGRLILSGRDRLALLHRMSTNDVESLQPGAGRPTIFTNANARILDRITVFQREDEALAITEPGRGQAVGQYLQRNIFFNDAVQINDQTGQTHQFALHGPVADDVIAAFVPTAREFAPYQSLEATLADAPLFIMRNRAFSGQHWTIVTEAQHAAAIWQALLEVGQPHGLQPAGSLTFNVLRICAGRPAVGRELSPDYIPLEVGLFDEISFKKGCYTGQEIIARMESRNRLAKIMIRLRLDEWVEAPADVQHEGQVVGRLTSSVQAPGGELFGLAVVKTAAASPNAHLTIGANKVNAHILDFASTPPPMIAQSEPR
jgi:folate-binding protein YgfZ